MVGNVPQGTTCLSQDMFLCVSTGHKESGRLGHNRGPYYLWIKVLQAKGYSMVFRGSQKRGVSDEVGEGGV